MDLLRVMVSVARADGNLAPSERDRIRQLVDFLRVGPEDAAEVEDLLRDESPVPALPESLDLPAYDLRLYVFQQALVMTFADGVVHEGEREVLDRLALALALEPAHVERAWRRAEEMSGR